MHGCCGHMGQVISQIVKEDADAQIVAGIDPFDNGKMEYPVYKSLEDCKEEADVVIDFASAKAEDALLDYCGANKLPVVVCTTGLSEEQLQKVADTAKKTAVLKSANMSLGINTLLNLLKSAAKVLAEAGFDMEIVEKHHNQKIDAPSGTALMLADALASVRDGETQYMYDRHAQRKKREKSEIGIHSVRGGTIVGEHEVIFAGNNEVITLSHSAQSKELFAVGAVNAAVFMSGKGPGLYDMSALV